MSPGLVAAFGHDRSFVIDNAGDLFRAPASRGTVELTGDTMSFTSKDSGVCVEGDTWSWRAGLTRDGVLRVVHDDEAAGDCRVAQGVEWTFVNISPRGRDGFTVEIPTVEQGLAPTGGQLEGIWVRILNDRGTELLVSFTADGSFAFDNGGELVSGAAVRGTYALEDDAITFRSIASPVCKEGDDWSWRVALVQEGLLHVTHLDEALDGPCHVPRGTEWTLLRVSPVSGVSERIAIAG